MLVQHCHGAPGIVNCFASFPDYGIDDLLIGAGELIWQSGPLRKDRASVTACRLAPPSMAA
jgi:hypothetical protein